MISLILICGLVVRLVSLNQSLWLDEATSALVARMSLTDIFTRFLPGDFHPPLYYLVLKYWVALFGSSEISLRVPSVIFGLTTVYIVYLIGRKLSNIKVGLIAASLLATSGLHIYYSQEARMYSLAALLATASVYFFQERKWLIFSLVMALIGLTDYVALLIVPIFFIAGWKDRRKAALGLLPLVFSFLIWLPIFLKQFFGGLSLAGSGWWNILGTVTFKNIALIPVKFIIGRISFDNKFIYALLATVAILIFGYLLFRARKAAIVLWAWLICPVVLGVILSIKVPTLAYFRFLFCLPAFYLLISVGIEKMSRYRNFFLSLILTINILTAGYYLINPKFQREDWRAAAKAIDSERIVFPADSQKEALIYYGRGSQIVRASDLEVTDREIWLSRYVWEIVDPTDSTKLKIEELGYNKAQEYNFNGVVFWKYIKSQYAYRD